MTIKAKTKLSGGNKNTQQVLFLQGLLQGIKKGTPQQQIPFKISVVEKYQGIRSQFEIYPNCKGFLSWRVITEVGKGLWQTWGSEEEIENTFRMMSLLA